MVWCSSAESYRRWVQRLWIPGWRQRSQSLLAGRDHLRGVLKARFRRRGAAQHSGHFVGAGAPIEQPNLHFGATGRLAFLRQSRPASFKRVFGGARCGGNSYEAAPECRGPLNRPHGVLPSVLRPWKSWKPRRARPLQWPPWSRDWELGCRKASLVLGHAGQQHPDSV